jgi:DNA polymerase
MLGAMGIRLWGPADDRSAAVAGVTSRGGVDTGREAASAAAGSAAPDAHGSATRRSTEPRSEGADASAFGSAAHGSSALGSPAQGAPAPGSSARTASFDDVSADAASAVWRALADQAAACTACALCGGRTRSVFGTGHRRADWLIVGDVPEADDDRTGEPFAGRAGRLLDNMLGAVGLSRGQAAAGRAVYLTQAVKCHPPNGRSPAADELAACEPFLRRQVELVRPRLILAMGRAAAQALLGSDEPIGRLRGRVHRYVGVPVVATHHPLFLLRHAQAKAEAWDDLCLAVETVMDSSGG